jgi:hypothetical protein
MLYQTKKDLPEFLTPTSLGRGKKQKKGAAQPQSLSDWHALPQKSLPKSIKKFCTNHLTQR